MTAEVMAWVVSYVVNAVWQIPVLFGAAWVSAGLLRRISVAWEHRMWVGASLFASLLPAFRFARMGVHMGVGRLLFPFWSHGGGSSGEGGMQAEMVLGAGTQHGVLRVSHGVLAGIALVYLGSVVYFGVRLGWGVWKTRRMAGCARVVELCGDVQRSWVRCCRTFGVGDARLALSPSVAGPVVLGFRQRWLLLPLDFLTRAAERDVEVALAHEFAHMTRQDFAKNLAYAVLALPVAFHPVLWLLRAGLAESREMVCDAMAAEAVEGRREYAQSLLRLAAMLPSGPQATTLHAIGIFDANTLERRIAMMTGRRMELRGMPRVATLTACLLIGGVTCISALGLGFEVKGRAESGVNSRSQASAVTAPKPVYKKVPVYPAQAKADKNVVNGSCVLTVSVDKDGVPTDVRVSKSLRADYDQSAMDAVREWRFTPALQDGVAVAADATVEITYSIG